MKFRLTWYKPLNLIVTLTTQRNGRAVWTIESARPNVVFRWVLSSSAPKARLGENPLFLTTFPTQRLPSSRSTGFFICASKKSVSFLAQTPHVARKSCEVRDSQIFPQCIHLTSFVTTSSYEGKPFGSKFSNIITSGSPEPRASQSWSRSNVFVSPHSHSRTSVRLPFLQTR